MCVCLHLEDALNSWPSASNKNIKSNAIAATMHILKNIMQTKSEKERQRERERESEVGK